MCVGVEESVSRVFFSVCLFSFFLFFFIAFFFAFFVVYSGVGVGVGVGGARFEFCTERDLRGEGGGEGGNLTDGRTDGWMPWMQWIGWMDGRTGKGGGVRVCSYSMYLIHGMEMQWECFYVLCCAVLGCEGGAVLGGSCI